MSWYCSNCGKVFDEPDTYSERVGEFWGAPAYEEFAVCPYCGEGGFDETESCGWCGDDWNPDALMWFPCTGFDTICPKCFVRECEPYKDEFLARSMGDPEDPGYTWRDQYEYVKSVPIFGVNDFHDFIRWEEEANEKFFLLVKEKRTREAAERGRRCGVKINYSEVKK